MRQNYSEDDIFDLAKFQSTYPDGNRESFDHESKTYYNLIDDYTYDGGHLTEIGSKWIASNLIKKLGSIKLQDNKE